ncbi:MAG: hypothetical protein NTW86_02320 [Candidatus Sumerlaeota bacterium]|nr:hypothetical protein [Candidatus Sumerlaeota bacterium]
MNIQEKVAQAVQDLPEDASIEDAMARLFLLAKIERGVAQADRGETVSHEAVREKAAKWLK